MNTTPTSRTRAPAICAVLAASLMGLAGCGDNPFLFRWSDVPDTVLLYSMARPELNIASGFAFLDGMRIAVEAPGASGTWDVAVDTRGGQLVLLPPGALGIEGTARITSLGPMNIADVTQAPLDTLVYIANDPVPLELGTIYVIKTNRRPGQFGARCVYYAKMEPLVLDVANNALTFQHVTNPVCNSTDLIPPE